MSEISAEKRLAGFFRSYDVEPSDFQFQPLTPDASTREYFRVGWRGLPAIACVYPQDAAGKAQFAACLDVTGLFRSAALPVAGIFASHDNQGIIIHEDFGDTILRNVLETSDETARENYLNQAIRLIAQIQAATSRAYDLNSVASRQKFDYEKLSWELDFFTTHYFNTLQKNPLSETDAGMLKAELDAIARELETMAKFLTHRDFHAANLMLQNGELKIIDHQDARIGSASYDLVSLLLDRVTTLPTSDWLAEKRRFFLSERERLGLEKISEVDFAYEFRLQTIQRCLKAIGTFSYQSAVRGKIYFIPFIKPMFEIVLRAAENLQKFPTLQNVIKKQIQENPN